jgi:hypothetical protein
MMDSVKKECISENKPDPGPEDSALVMLLNISGGIIICLGLVAAIIYLAAIKKDLKYDETLSLIDWIEVSGIFFSCFLSGLFCLGFAETIHCLREVAHTAILQRGKKI